MNDQLMLTGLSEEAVVGQEMLPTFLGESRVTSGPLKGATLASIGTFDTPANGGGIQLQQAGNKLDELVKDLAAARAALAALKDINEGESQTAKALKGRIRDIVKKINEELRKKGYQN